ncbi:MAG: RNA 2',3'-cyclic phosphodiesterase [Chthonomonadales bacterium]
MRLFYAVLPPSNVLNMLGEQVATWRQQADEQGIRWTDPTKFHFTVRFLGETSLQKTQSAMEVGRELAARMVPFEVTFGAPGAFPDRTRPNVIWVGLESGDADLKFLAESLDARTESLGFRKEPKAFSPHLTIARTKTYGAEEVMSNWLASSPEMETISFPVNSFFLMQTVPGAAGSTYREVERFTFAPEPERLKSKTHEHTLSTEKETLNG